MTNETQNETSKQDLQELDKLRKFKQLNICQKLVDCFKRDCEHFDREEEYINELRTLHKRRIEFFKTHFETTQLNDTDKNHSH